MAYSNIDKPSKYFNTVLYTGTGSTQSVTGVGFQPDFVWIKDRTTAGDSHNLFDAVRGTTKRLFSDLTNAENTNANSLSAFNSDGFTVNTDSESNRNGSNFVAWNWLANNTSGSSNTSGTITSTVSANTTSGFSIVSYTGTNANATVGHGLGVAPKFIIVKSRSDVASWHCYHSKLTDANYYILLNSTSAQTSQTSIWQGTAPTSSVFSIGVNGSTNANGSTYIAYCFAEVKGFSKAFSYTGNGSTDGSYVYCGFRPAWILLKKSDGSTQNWVMHDSKRNTYNLSQNKLFANLSDAEGTDATNYNLDILSNGFKLRSSNSDVNSSGGAYIGFAIAEQPFVSSKGIVANAR